MSHASIAQAAQDPQLRARVEAAAHREVVYNQELADTVFGKNLAQGMQTVNALMYPVAVETEAAYASALAAGRGAPGYDTDIITDEALTSAVVASWPPDPTPPQ